MKRLFGMTVFCLFLGLTANGYVQPVRDTPDERDIQEEVVIRIPVRNGHFDFREARVDGGVEVKPPYSVNVNEMVSIPLQIGTGSWHCVYLHFPDCRYIRIWVP